ncbi:MAG: hypothetical protein ABSE82_12025, partial [Nitrososphaerales archaeon]
LIGMLVLPEPSAYSSSSILVIYSPPSVASDNHLYPFLMQAQSVVGTPLDLNTTVYLSSSSPRILNPTKPELNLVDGQGVFYANATNAGSVKIYAGAEGFLPSSVTVEVVSSVEASPYTLSILTPPTAIVGEKVPVIVESQGVGGSPVASSLSYELSSSPLGGNISTAPTVVSGSFRGSAYSIQYMNLPDNGAWALSASGNYFSPGNQSFVSVLDSSETPPPGNGMYSLHASYFPTVSAGSVWPVIVYPTLDGFPMNFSSVQQLSNSSSNPNVASVVGSATANQYYEIYYVQASKTGSAVITFQAQGYLPVTVTLNCVSPQTPFVIRAYGPSSSYANPAQLLEVVSTPSFSNISIPIHLNQTGAEVTSSYPGLAEHGINFADGFAGLNLSTPMLEPATFLVQAEGMYATSFSASLIYIPFTITIESNAPDANFTVQWVENRTNALTNSSIQLSEPAVVTAPQYLLTNNGTIQYEFSYWVGNQGNSTTDYVHSTSTLFAHYTRSSFLTTVETNLPERAVNMSVHYEYNSADINRTETSNFTIIAPQGLTVSTSKTVLGSQQGVLYVFTGWSDGVNATTRFVSAGSNITAEYMTEYLVSASTSNGEVINGSGYFKAGSVAELKLDTTSVPSGFLIFKVFSGWEIINGSATKATNPYFLTVSSPTKLTAMWEVDYSRLIVFIAALVILATGGLYGFAAWKRRHTRQT